MSTETIASILKQIKIRAMPPGLLSVRQNFSFGDLFERVWIGNTFNKNHKLPLFMD